MSAISQTSDAVMNGVLVNPPTIPTVESAVIIRSAEDEFQRRIDALRRKWTGSERHPIPVKKMRNTGRR